MKIPTSPTNSHPFLTIVACQHGDEPFGLEVIKQLKPQLHTFPHLKLIVANEDALTLGQRGVDGDLNRSFPGNPAGNHEQRIAFQLMKTLRHSTYVLDIHTSVSRCGRLLPILTTLNEQTRRLINLLDVPRVLCVEPPLGSASLIGNVKAGLSLEFEKACADDQSVQMVIQLVKDLYAGNEKTPRQREMYLVTDVLPAGLPELATAQDFEFLEAQQCYPVLINPKPTIGNQGLKATRKELMVI